MRITRLIIKNLHKNFNYDIRFNNDITIIYGLNGTGKTTILNIISAIITGQVEQLFFYDFDEIKLSYFNVKSQNEETISIKRKASSIDLVFDEEKETFDYRDYRKLTDRAFEEEREFMQYSLSPIAKKLANKFRSFYLPLNRIDSRNKFTYRRVVNRRMYRDHISTDDIWEKDEMMYNVQELIRNYYLQVSEKIAKINQKFKNDLLKSATNVADTNFESVFQKFINKRNNVIDISEIKERYINVLISNELITQEESEKYRKFFDSFIAELKSEKKDQINLDYILKYYEILRIQKIIEISVKSDEQKKKITKPLDDFVKVLNEFLQQTDFEKTVELARGSVVFKDSRDNPINLSYLSSGEKQLITFFANLFFSQDLGESGIFLVDEPELSLHLIWQSMFVKKAMESNQKVQLILATHSPEIIGTYTKNIFKLERKISNE